MIIINTFKAAKFILLSIISKTMLSINNKNALSMLPLLQQNSKIPALHIPEFILIATIESSITNETMVE
jgi:hypothetical protein